MPELLEERPSPPGTRSRSPRMIALLLIGVGVLLVINQSGLLGSAFWSVVVPVGMIAFGLDLVTNGLQRRRIDAGALLALVVLMPLVGVGQLFDRPELDGDAEEAQQFAQTDIEQLRANVEMTAGDLRIRRLDDEDGPPLQLEAGRFERQAREDSVGVAEIRPHDTLDGDIDLRVNPKFPLDLTANIGAGEADELDFSDTRLRSLNLNLGAGDANITLPDEGVIDVTINGSVGDIELDVPDDLEARIEIESTFGDTEIGDRFEQQSEGVYVTEGYNNTAPNRANIRITSTVGEVTVD